MLERVDNTGAQGFGAYVLRQLMDNLGTVNAAIERSAGMHRAKRSSLNVAAVARLMHTNRNRLRRLLDDTEPWTSDDVRYVAGVLNMSEEASGDLERRRLRARRQEYVARLPRLAQNDSESKGLFMLNRWTRDMPLVPQNLEVVRVERSAEPASAALIGEMPPVRGVVAVPVRVGELDWNEAPDQNVFRVQMAEAPYSATLATRRTFTTNKELKGRLASRAADGDVAGVIDLAPYSLVAANVNLVTADAHVVLAKRSSIVLMNKNEWNLGINESMKIAPAGRPTEDFFDLARRGLREELAVPEDSIDRLVVNWFGYCTACCNFYVYAHARTTMFADEVREELHRARDTREFAAVELRPVTSDSLADVIEGLPVEGDPDTRWLHHAALSAHLLWTEMDTILA